MISGSAFRERRPQAIIEYPQLFTARLVPTGSGLFDPSVDSVVYIRGQDPFPSFKLTACDRNRPQSRTICAVPPAPCPDP